VDEHSKSVQLTDEQRIEWLRLIRSPNIGPRGMRQQTHLESRCRAKLLRA
jgi:hypothetical protein